MNALSPILANDTPGIRPSRRADVVAEALGHDLSTIHKMVKAGILEGYWGGPKRGRLMIYLDSVAAYQAGGAIGPAARQAEKAKRKASRAQAGEATRFLREVGCL